MQYATARVGAILVNVNPAYRMHELEYALKQSGVSTLVMARAFRETRLRGHGARGPAPLPGAAPDRSSSTTSGPTCGTSAIRLSEDELRQHERELQFDDPINIQYTSGTTGFPKGATLSHHNILNNGFFIGEFLAYTERDRVCIPVPFYHCFGMVLGNMACTTHGATMVIPGDSFDPLAVMRTVQAERCTSLYGVPTMFIAELDHPEFKSFDFSSLRTGIMAGSPCPVEVMKRVQKDMHMPEVTICYGMTETSPVSTQSRVRRPAREARLDGGAGPPPRRGQGHRSDHRPDRAPRDARRALHPRLLGDARLLGRPARHRARPSTTAAGCTPATSPPSTTTAT